MARPTKRRTKHRGNAAGMIESRGVTSSRSSSAKNGKTPQKGGRADPRLREPTWRSAFIRALFAAGIFALVMVTMMKGNPIGVVVTSVVLLGIYTPFGFYFDRFLWRRRMAKLNGTQPPAKPAKGKRP